MLTERGALVGASDHGSTKALYAQDPDGIEFEVSWLVPADLLDPDETISTRPLHLDGRSSATAPTPVVASASRCRAA